MLGIISNIPLFIFSLLEKILISEEEHLDFLETQLDLIKSLGLEIYLSTQV